MELARLSDGSTLTLGAMYHSLQARHLELRFTTVPTVGSTVQAGVRFYRQISVHFDEEQSAVYQLIKDYKPSEIVSALLAQWPLYADEETRSQVPTELWELFRYVETVGLAV